MCSSGGSNGQALREDEKMREDERMKNRITTADQIALLYSSLKAAASYSLQYAQKSQVHIVLFVIHFLASKQKYFLKRKSTFFPAFLGQSPSRGRAGVINTLPKRADCWICCLAAFDMDYYQAS